MKTTDKEKCYKIPLEKDGSLCYYCTNKALYSEPEEKTGQIIDVCNEHFRMKFGG
jgi:hypothetical protein